MSIRPEVIDAMIAAGCTVEQIAQVVKADYYAEQAVAEAKLQAKRTKEAEKKRRQRAAQKAALSPLVPGDNEGHEGTTGDMVPLDKEAPPDPLKKLNPSRTHEGHTREAACGIENLTPGNVVCIETARRDSPQKRAHRLPKDFTLTSDRLNMGLAFGMTDSEVRHAFEEFCDYWWGCGKTHIDWDCTLRNRFRTVAQRKAGRAALGAGRPGPVSIVETALRVAARYEARGLSGEPDYGSDAPLPF